MKKYLPVLFVLMLMACNTVNQTDQATQTPSLAQSTKTQMPPTIQDTATVKASATQTPTQIPTETPILAVSTATLDPTTESLFAMAGSMGPSRTSHGLSTRLALPLRPGKTCRSCRKPQRGSNLIRMFIVIMPLPRSIRRIFFMRARPSRWA